MPLSVDGFRTGSRTPASRRRSAGRRRAAAATRPAGPGRVVVIGASVGQGHDGAARELARRLVVAGVDVAVHDYLDALPAAVAAVLRDLYAPTVQYLPRVFDGLFRGLEHPGPLRRLGRWTTSMAEARVAGWARDADVVVSTYPLASQTLGDLRRQDRLAATSITYLTDPAAHALWCHGSIDLHLAATRAAAGDAARHGVDAVVAGPLCAPAFDRARQSGRLALRARLGLPRSAPVAMVGAGSLGMGDVQRTVAAILHHPQARALVLCGRNTALRRRLRGSARVVPLGWRDDVPELMGAVDVLVHNAGGLSVTEALVAGLPAVTYLPIPGHGRANAAVLERAGVAAWPRTPQQLRAAIDRVHAARAHVGRVPTVPSWPPGADPAAVVERALAAHRAQVPRASGF